MSRPRYRYEQKEIPAFLRALADEMEARAEGGEAEFPEVAVVVHGSLGEVFYVDGAGEAGSVEALGVLELGKRILTNALLGQE